MNQEELDQRMYANMMAGNDKQAVISAIKDIANETETIEEIRFALTGKKVYYDANGTKQVISIDPPMLSDYGAQEIIKLLKVYLSKDITLSCFEDKEIKLRCKQFRTQVCFMLARNWNDYGLDSRTEHNQIVAMLDNHLRATLNRSLRGLTLIKALENTHVSEVRSFEEREKEPGLLGNIFRRRP